MKFLHPSLKVFLIILIASTAFRTTAQVPINFTVSVPALLVVDAGPDSAGYAGTRILIGGSPAITGGTTPYDIVWSPSSGLSDINLANPWAFPTVRTVYTLNVTDANLCTDNDKIIVYMDHSGIQDLSGKLLFNIFPNPNKGRFTVMLDGNYQDFAMDMAVYNSVGKVVFSDVIYKVYGVMEKTIDLSGNPKGVYFVRLTGENTNLTRKLFVE